MKKHTGIRPQDIVVLLAIMVRKGNDWVMKDLAAELGISASEISESLNRSSISGLVSSDKKRVLKTALLELLEHGLKYVFPQHPGGMATGVPTAHSASPLNTSIQGSDPVVWPYAEGKTRGFSIEPLHKNVPQACLKNEQLHQLLALTDALRIGKPHERQLAIQELKNRMLVD